VTADQAREMFVAATGAMRALAAAEEAVLALGRRDIAGAFPRLSRHVGRMFVLPLSVLLREADGAWPPGTGWAPDELEHALAASRRENPTALPFELALATARRVVPG
jgi:hypothetical protein